MTVIAVGLPAHLGRRVKTVGGLTASERYAFDVAGYLVRRAALNRREVAALNDAVDGLRVPVPGDDIAKMLDRLSRQPYQPRSLRGAVRRQNRLLVEAVAR